MEGYVIAAVFGVTLGTLMGMSDTIKKIFYPTVTTIRQIPIMAWIPLLILWCGIGEKSKIVVIVIAAFFPIMVNTLTGISSTPESYIEVARLYKLSRFKTFLRVYLPHALPNIQTGLKLGLGVSWMAVVAAELIASTSGIGYKMSYARTLMRSDIVIICMIVIGIVGIIMDKILTVVFSALSPWEKKAHK
jgi:sulfonate transport system permease protein